MSKRPPPAAVRTGAKRQRTSMQLLKEANNALEHVSFIVNAAQRRVRETMEHLIEIKSLKERVCALRQSNNHVKKQNDDLTTENHNKKNQIKKLEKEKRDRDNQIKCLKDAARKSEKEISQLTKSNRKHDHWKAALKEEINRIGREINQFGREMMAIDKKLEESSRPSFWQRDDGD